MTEQATNSRNEEITEELTEFFDGGKPAEGQTPPQTQKQDEQQQAAQGEAQQAEALEGKDAAQEQPQEKEVVIDGKPYMVPAEIADKFIHHADYTRKTQDLAEMRRATLAEREASNLERAFHQQVAQERNQLLLLEAQIAQYGQLNWQAMEMEQLLKARASLDQLKDAKAALEGTVKAKRADFDSRIKGHVREALQAGNKFVAQHIKGYDDSARQELFQYGVGEGYTQEEMERLMDPRIIVTLWKAKQWDALKASQPELQKRAAKAAPVVRPGATQPPVPRVQQLVKGIKDAKTQSGKTRAAEDYFTERFR